MVVEMVVEVGMVWVWKLGGMYVIVDGVEWMVWKYEEGKMVVFRVDEEGG